MITVEARTRCQLCGYFLSLFAFPTVRVNRRSIRQLDGGMLRMNPGRCPECGTGGRGNGPYSPLPAGSFLASPWMLTAKSLAEVESYRARKWPW